MTQTSNTSMKIKKKEYVIDDELNDFVQEVIKKHTIDIGPALVAFVLVYPHISKTKAAKISKCSPKDKFLSGFDFVVELSGQLWDQVKEETKEALMLHQLMHILPVINDKTGDVDLKLRQHDVQDFSKVLTKFGHNWMSELKVQMSSIHNLKPAEEDNITY